MREFVPWFIIEIFFFALMSFSCSAYREEIGQHIMTKVAATYLIPTEIVHIHTTVKQPRMLS